MQSATNISPRPAPPGDANVARGEAPPKNAALLHLLLLAIFFCLTQPLSANNLYERLRQIVPGDGTEAVTERQFLYQRTSQLFAILESEEKVHRKGKKKRIKRIRKFLAEKVLTTYQATAELEDVFRTGAYNDDAATLLLALCLEQYNVDYAVYVDHWRTYLVADPGGKDIDIDYSPERKRSDDLRKAYRQDYLQLVRQTIQPELPQLLGDAAATTFYNNYYRPDRRLTFGQLVAHYHYTLAKGAYAEGDYITARGLLEQALQRENRVAFVTLLQAVDNQLASAEAAITQDIGELFASWQADPDNAYAPAALLHHFDNQQRLILTSNEPSRTETLLASYLTRAPAASPTYRKNLTQLQQLRLLQHYFATEQIDQAHELARQLYEADPADERLQYLLGELVVAQLRLGVTTGDAFRQRLTIIAEEYPWLRAQDRFVDLALRERALVIRDLYDGDRPDLALPVLNEFRESLRDLQIGQERSLWTLTAFAAASYYHFRVEDYGRAVAFIEEALEYAPEDQYLIHRLLVLRNYL